MKIDIKYTIGFLVAVTFIIGGFFAFNNPVNAIAEGNEASFATSTNTSWSLNTPKLLKNGPGTFDKVIITKASNATMNFYNATTTNINLRTGNTSTTSITLAQFGEAATTGTYEFNAVVSTGLIAEVTGTAGISSSTITWR